MHGSRGFAFAAVLHEGGFGFCRQAVVPAKTIGAALLQPATLQHLLESFGLQAGAPHQYYFGEIIEILNLLVVGHDQ